MKQLVFKSLLLMFVTTLLLTSCGGNNDSIEDNEDVTSPATIEYLCSATVWFYAPDTGINKDEPYESFAFFRIGELLNCTILGNNGAEGGKFSFTFNDPVVSLKEIDIIGKEVVGGKTRTLNVYKLTKKKDNNKYLLINGKQYIGAGDGIDLK